MNSFSFTVNDLLSNLAGHRGLHNSSNGSFEIDAKFINIEKGFLVVYAKIQASQKQKLVQIADDNKSWSIMCLSDKPLCFNDYQYPSGLFVGFNNKTYALTIEPNQELNLILLLIHKSYIQQYQYSECFRRIKKSKKEIYYIPSSKLIHLPQFTPEKTMGLVKTKFFSISLLTALRVEAEKIRINLKKKINSYCTECLESKQDILCFISQKLLIEPRYLLLLFNEIFQQDVFSYYNDFKINNAKNFIRTNKEQLDKIILECLKGPCPVVILLAIQFELSTEKYKRLFLEETGERLSQYCEKLKLNVARKLLLNGFNTRKVANTIGFSNPITLSRFFYRNEGLSPKQFRNKIIASSMI